MPHIFDRYPFPVVFGWSSQGFAFVKKHIITVTVILLQHTVNGFPIRRPMTYDSPPSPSPRQLSSHVPVPQVYHFLLRSLPSPLSYLP